MDLNVSPDLALAICALGLYASSDPAEVEIGAMGLALVCDYVPVLADDAAALLALAGSILPDGEARNLIVASRNAIMDGETDAALVALSEAVTATNAVKAVISERLCYNVLAAPVPLVLTFRPPMIWELPHAGTAH